MARLSSLGRKQIPTRDFGLPGSRKYPMEDKAHARDAEARASEMYNRGRLSAAEKAEIDAKARRKLGKVRGRAQ